MEHFFPKSVKFTHSELTVCKANLEITGVGTLAGVGEYASTRNVRRRSSGERGQREQRERRESSPTVMTKGETRALLKLRNSEEILANTNPVNLATSV